MSLSKSQYIRGLQCHKSLWLYKNSPELRETPSDSQESLFNTGNTVGDYAKKLFPNGVEIEFIPNGLYKNKREFNSYCFNRFGFK